MLADRIRGEALAWAVASASVVEIDSMNILHASMLAMRRAVLALSATPRVVLVDGNRAPPVPYPVRTVVAGDATVAEIAAASILAKVARDAAMRELHRAYPGYAFDEHKGYGTAAHLEALHRLGPCPAHRRSFAPVRRALAGEDPVDSGGSAVPSGPAQ